MQRVVNYYSIQDVIAHSAVSGFESNSISSSAIGVEICRLQYVDVDALKDISKAILYSPECVISTTLHLL